ncbi:carbohydrate ABC transporter permease [Corynebacterium breve]|uniref:Carbohydrate ABC transporter permease n=1 Tax=Corynebacterium breve TaxID=3049799 RepID=A0ABY8VD03_9CORY|nr:carbohydrate ABC transporter permease [Corynebacterium breve]WIM67531.1 carbohydrate ABC transporter permease [Corynebacterium breve]
MTAPERALPPVPGTQGDGEPTITDKQRNRKGAGVEHSSVWSKALGYIALVVTVLVIMVPMYFIVITSLKTYSDIYADPISFWPNPVEVGNYIRVLEVSGFLEYFRNSMIITTVLTIIEVTLGVLSAYGFAFLRFPGRNVLFLLVIATLMVPNQITIISNYALIAEMGLRNTYMGVILPLAAVAFGTYLMRNHFLSLPKEIMEAASMDGAGFWTTLFKVVLPMSWPTLSAFILITVVGEWNQYLWPFLITDTAATAPLPVGLTRLQDAEGLTNWGPVMAGTVLTTVPMLLVFLLLQKNMIKGLTAGAVKG